MSRSVAEKPRKLTAPRHVVMLAYHGAQVLDIAGPVQLLSAAQENGQAAYRIELVAEQRGSIQTTSGLTLQADRAFADLGPDELASLDTFIVSGGNGSREEMGNEALLTFVRKAAKQARRTVSICTGSFILGAAGLLDGRRAATHWAYAPLMRQLLPKVQVDEDAIYVRDGKFWTSAGVTAGMDLRSEALLTFVRKAAKQARRTVSICTGSFILGAAGLLDGRRAATHWAYAPLMRQLLPKVQVDEDAIYVRDGKFWTSAGVTAGMDLTLALIEADLGREMALTLARHHVMYLMRPGGQSQFSAELAAQHVGNERLAKLCAFIIENPSETHSVPELAARCHMSERSFARHFVAETGFTPAQFVERARLDEACRRLASGDASLDAVSAASGFGAAERMRRAFLRHLGVTPGRYRERFQTSRREQQTYHSHL